MSARVSALKVSMVIAVAAMCAGAADVTVDWATPYQTIDGFGFFGPMDVWWSGGPFWSDAWGNLILNDLGITIWRNEYYSEEGSQDANWAKQVGMVQSLKAKADQLNVPLKFIFSVWSAPSQWKSNSSLKNGGSLLTQYYDEYGAWLRAGVQKYADAGVQLYALSAQNEPAFEEYYNSTVYTPEQYRDMIKIAAPIVKATYPNVKFFGAEDMLAAWAARPFIGRIMADTMARRLCDIIAVHGYSDGVNPTPSSQAASLWSGLGTNLFNVGKPLWMTETSGTGSDWAGAVESVNSVFAAVRYGKLKGWVWWYGSGDLVTTTALTKKGYALKHFYRYVRPGAVMYNVTDASASNLFVAAFSHATEHTMTLVVINMGGAQTLNISGTGLPSQFQKFQTTSSDNCRDMGTTGTSVSLAGSSITTLYATNFTVSVKDPSMAVRTEGVTRPVAQGRIYDLRGRMVPAAEAAVRGAYCRIDKDGRNTVRAEVFAR